MSIRTTSIKYAYPLDSSTPVEFDENGLPIYDRAYNASDLRRVMALILTDGVFPDDGDELAVTYSSGTWSVGTGTFVANGLMVPVDDASQVIDQDDISSGSYAYLIAAGRFDSNTNDGAIYAIVTQSPTYEPVRTESVWELVLARIDWRGTMSDYRLDSDLCGAVAPVIPVDTDSFMAELFTAVDQFNLNVGNVTSLPSGATPEVTVRKPDVAGQNVYIDFAIPRGMPGEDGKDGDAVPSVYVQPEGEEPARSFGAVWMVDDRSSDQHEITDIRVFETDSLYPGETTFPGADLFPGGAGQWVSHKLASSLVSAA